MKLILYFIITIIVLIVGSLLYWQSKAVSEAKFSGESVQYFAKYMKTNLPRQDNTLKIVSWNIGYASGLANNLGAVLSEEEVGRNLQTLAQEIKKLDPDILFLQEVDFQSKRSHFINQFEFLANSLQMPYGAYDVLWNKKYVPYPYWPLAKHFGQIVSGQAVLTRLPVLSQDVVAYQKPPHAFWYNWFYLDRVLQRMRVKWLGEELVLWNVHHEAFNPVTRFKQAQLLGKDVLENECQYKIVAGDFNDPTQDEALKLRGMGVDSTLQQFENVSQLQCEQMQFPEPALTFPSDAPNQKLDHILTSGNFKFIERKVICSDASDHCLIYVEIEKDKIP